MPGGEKNHVMVGSVGERIAEVEGSVALALIDCVEYEVVLRVLRKVYPLMSAGGIIIVHSYNHSWEGVKRAVDQFVAGIPEGVLPLPDMYGSVGIVRGS